MSEPGALVIDITPHHGAMTKAGKANFVRFCDGASEFIDNSIQAYLKTGSGEADPVCVRLFMRACVSTRLHVTPHHSWIDADIQDMLYGHSYLLRKLCVIDYMYVLTYEQQSLWLMPQSFE